MMGSKSQSTRNSLANTSNLKSEADRLDFLHMMMVKATGEKLFLTPIEEDKIHRILDIGTGTGICKLRLSRLNRQ